MSRKNKNYNKKSNKMGRIRSFFTFSRMSNRKMTRFIVLGIIANILLCVGIVFAINLFVDTSERLSNYRALQEKQISSVRELCFDVGVSGSMLHSAYNEDRMTIKIFMNFAKEEYSSLYESTFNDICFKPLALISGKEFEGTGTAEEKVKSLLEDRTSGSATDTVNNSTYTVVENAFDAVKW